MPKKVTIYYCVKTVLSLSFLILYFVYYFVLLYNIVAAFTIFTLGVCTSTTFIVIDSYTFIKNKNQKYKELIIPYITSWVCVIVEILWLIFYAKLAGERPDAPFFLKITTMGLRTILMVIISIRVTEFVTNMIAVFFLESQKAKNKAKMSQYADHIRELFYQEMNKINKFKSYGLINDDEYDELIKSIEVKYNMHRID